MTTTTTTVVTPGVVQAQPVVLVQGHQTRRDWSTGLCDCCADCHSCCYSFWCWPCFTCSLASKLDEYACGPCCCGPLFMVPLRTKTRTMYNISGSICDDICCVAYCPCCTMTQIWRELELSGPRV